MQNTIVQPESGIEPINWLNITVPNAPAPAAAPKTFAPFLIGNCSTNKTGNIYNQVLHIIAITQKTATTNPTASAKSGTSLKIGIKKHNGHVRVQ